MYNNTFFSLNSYVTASKVILLAKGLQKVTANYQWSPKPPEALNLVKTLFAQNGIQPHPCICWPKILKGDIRGCKWSFPKIGICSSKGHPQQRTQPANWSRGRSRQFIFMSGQQVPCQSWIQQLMASSRCGLSSRSLSPQNPQTFSSGGKVGPPCTPGSTGSWRTGFALWPHHSHLRGYSPKRDKLSQSAEITLRPQKWA